MLTNARTPIDAGVSITGALIGTRRLYHFADRNPAIGMRSSAYTHKQAILSQLPKLITINAALKVDLTGQMDFVRVGARSPAGHAFIALPATAKGGKISRITMPRSGPVTTAARLM